MLPRRLLWRFMSGFLLVIVLSTVVVAWYVGESVRTFDHRRTREQLESKAQLIAAHVSPLLESARFDELQRFCRDVRPATAARITVIDASGRVLSDTDEDPKAMENHADRVEVKAALAGDVGQTTRYSSTIGAELSYVAVPVRRNGAVTEVVRTAVKLADLRESLRDVYWQVGLGGLMAALLMAGLTVALFTRQISQPLRELERGARAFAAGHLDHPLAVPSSVEIGALAEALNAMSAQLQDRLVTIARQSSQLEAILASMSEGVLAMDASGRLIRINAAAAQMVGVDAAAAEGCAVFEIVRHRGMERFVAQAIKANEPIGIELILNFAGEDRFIHLHATTLRDASAAALGLLIVMHDRTPLRRLEQIRQEFVANVSHELKTPIAAIKAAVETLQVVSTDPESTQCLAIANRQADRLNSIVDDLLSLARIEQEEERGQVELTHEAVLPVLTAAVETCLSKAQQRGIALVVDAADDLRAHLNPPL